VVEKSVAEKAHVKPGTAIAVIDPVAGLVESLGLQEPRFVEAAEGQLVFTFVRSRDELEAKVSSALASLAPAAALWVFFRKGSKTAGLDMSRNDVWYAAEKLGMRPIGLLSVNAEWSVFRLKRSG
jgi:hypothetical protein